MPDDLRRAIQERFAPVAGNYVTSSYHAGEAGLQEVLDLARPGAGERAVDVATGTGNTALALAPQLGWVTGVDFTREMLDEARKLAASRAIANADWVLADAAALPFRDGAFDLYTVRAAPHHFPDIPATLREAYRVLRPGGRAALIDCTAPPEARDTLHRVEVIRDPSHVLSLTLDEWRRELEGAGFEVTEMSIRELDWEFLPWMRRIGAGDDAAAAAAEVLETATGSAGTRLRPERRDGALWHAYWHALIRARRPG